MAELIVALDVATKDEAEAMVRKLGDVVSFYKVGLELFSADGPAVIAMVKGYGKRVFLDLKLHDIPRTVERAVERCAAMGVDLLTIHASGGRAMVRAAMAAAGRAAQPPRILAVTALTSLDQGDLSDLGVCRSLRDHVIGLGKLAVLDGGADGIVCSPQEVAAMRAELGEQALLVTPGVRPSGTAVGDQKRIATPAAAVQDGSTHLVVGRPVLEAADPQAAAAAIIAEMMEAAV
ncbi:MAG: orotidine-5'-phosphate decarboxylase [Lentisphaerae bacterium]|jgi:orotidine-5'-phosphate decarboxylase|nr:orotidine-5'-phosphate decarboxylase [Lentisphaerota bacterium]